MPSLGDVRHKAKPDPLAFLLDLNHQLAAAEKAGTAIVGPGLPPYVTEPGEFSTSDCVQPPKIARTWHEPRTK